MNIGRTLVQAGRGLRAAQDYDEQQSARSYAQRAREFGIKSMESAEQRRVAQDELLPEEVQARRGVLGDQRRTRDNQEAYRQLVADGASFDDLATAAQQRGDLPSVTEFRKAKDTFENQGIRKVITAALSGASDQELEKLYNSNGDHKVDPGSVKLDQKTGVVSFTVDGEPGQRDLTKMGRLLGMTKAPVERVVPAGAAIARDGKITDVNTQGVEAKHEARLAEIDRTGEQRQELARQRGRPGGGGRATALERNLQVLVDAGVATDRADAYSKLRTSAGEPEEKAVRSLTVQLMKAPGYTGRGGREKALRDATEMVRSIRGGGRQAGPAPAGGGSYTVQGKTFTDADLEATAQQYGISVDEVKRRAGIR